MMQESLILTVVGTDHPGIVSQISKIVSEHGGGWYESQMAHLAGQFAGLMRAQVDSSNYKDLCTELQALSAEGLHITVTRERSTTTQPGSAHMQRLRLEVVGSDQQGIVRDISAILASHAINVEELSTEVSPAPMSSHLQFIAAATVEAPVTLDLNHLQDELEGLSHDLMVELNELPSPV